MMRLTIKPVLMLLVCGVSLSLVGCSGAAGAKGPQIVPGAHLAAQTRAEYVAEEAKLPPLPAGAKYLNPDFIKSTDANGILETYGPGLGTQYADTAWECFWSVKVVADPTNSPAYNADVATLATYKNTFTYKTQKEAREGFDPMIQSAKLGDTSDLAQFVTANCRS